MSLRIKSVNVRSAVDESPDLTFLGQYTNNCEDHHIINVGEHKGEFVFELKQGANVCPIGWDERSSYKYFIPCAGDEKPRCDKRTRYVRYARQDFEQMDSYNGMGWHMVIVWAEAEVWNSITEQVHRISAGHLGGVYSEMDGDEKKTYALDCLFALRAELSAFGFGQEQIDEAFEKACVCEGEYFFDTVNFQA